MGLVAQLAGSQSPIGLRECNGGTEQSGGSEQPMGPGTGQGGDAYLLHHMFHISNLLICNLLRFATWPQTRSVVVWLSALSDLASCGHVRPLAHM
ncbi:unnamed protein product [Pleuronectes platessa]|uniref:Uncharacterized protein n=1 Tax=Pleuronectes platessa TaxID=8262 RepID=A0A9N7UCN7_PLEPL|nr:unnamed protein product [Pleuronectes platessa]